MQGNPNPDIRKVERPPYEQLLEEIEATSYLAVGRKYGVSDNAVRKWVRWYERQIEREAAESEKPGSVAKDAPGSASSRVESRRAAGEHVRPVVDRVRRGA